MFQCPHGLELLRHEMAIALHTRCFNALMGLSCYRQYVDFLGGKWSFNVLMGLSCYFWFCSAAALLSAFQCPHGLELLR